MVLDTKSPQISRILHSILADHNSGDGLVSFSNFKTFQSSLQAFRDRSKYSKYN